MLAGLGFVVSRAECSYRAFPTVMLAVSKQEKAKCLSSGNTYSQYHLLMAEKGYPIALGLWMHSIPPIYVSGCSRGFSWGDLQAADRQTRPWEIVSV
jgi:hypothetical protein